MKKGLIVLDPGHGQYANAHTTKEGYYEGTQNYILAQPSDREGNVQWRTDCYN